MIEYRSVGRTALHLTYHRSYDWVVISVREVLRGFTTPMPYVGRAVSISTLESIRRILIIVNLQSSGIFILIREYFPVNIRDYIIMLIIETCKTRIIRKSFPFVNSFICLRKFHFRVISLPQFLHT